MKKTGSLLFLFILFTILPRALSGAESLTDSLTIALGKAPEKDRANILNLISDEYERTDPVKAKDFAEQALKSALKNHDKAQEAIAYLNIATILSIQSEDKNAKDYYQKSLNISENGGSKSTAAQCYSHLGMDCNDRGEYEKALTYLLKGLKLAKEANERQVTGALQNNIGNIYLSKNEYKTALEYFTTSLNIYKEIGYKRGLGGAYSNIGACYFRLGDTLKAIDYLQNSLVIRKELNNKVGIAISLINLAEMFKAIKQYSQALTYAEHSLELFAGLGDKTSVGYAYGEIATIHLDMKQYPKALEYSLKALDNAKETGNRKMLIEAFQEVYRSYAAIGDYTKACYFSDLMAIYKDSANVQESINNFSEIAERFNTETKEEEIDLLTKEKELNGLNIIAQAASLERQRTLSWVSIGGFILLLLLSVTLYTRYKYNKKNNFLLQQQNENIIAQKKEIELRKQETTDSINYAKRIQQSILPPTHAVENAIPNSFVLYRPKDIVSGDFYWVEKKGDISLFAAVDCTGHGVPGALMSVVGLNLINQAVNEQGLTKPSDVLGYLDKGVTQTLRQSTGEEGSVKDSMDIAFCSLNNSTGELQYSGVMNPLYIVRKGVLSEVTADRMSIGLNTGNVADVFTNHSFFLSPGDTVYIFSDGYADQFGGPKGKKFKKKNLQSLILSMQEKNMKEQLDTLNNAFDEWKGSVFQVDDILVIGVKII